MLNRRALVVCAASLVAIAGSAQAQSFFQNFEAGLPGTWAIHNQSNPIGGTIWYTLVNYADVPAHSGAQAAYANYNNASDVGTISDWLILDAVTLRNGDVFSFWTSTNPFPFFPDRLQVRLSQAGASTNTGSTETDVGDFTTLLLDINPTYTTTDYPTTATQFSITLSGLPAGGVGGRIAFRYFVEDAGPLGNNSDLIMVDDVAYTSVTDVSGGCCFDDGSCALLPSAVCTSNGGTYAGNGITCAAANCQPVLGACCLVDGSCQSVTSFSCQGMGGVYHGNNVACGSISCPQPWHEVGDAGDLPGTAQAVTGTGPVSAIIGHADAGDADMYKIRICDVAHFSASTIADDNDSQLFLFDATGKGLAMNDGNENDLAGTILTSQFVPAAGDYYLAYTLYNRDPVDSSLAFIWTDEGPSGNYFPEWAPDGPGAANPIGGWDGAPDFAADYTIVLNGTCYIGGSCYANCDNSSAPPILNANDFQCFLNKFATQDPTANCDNSTTPPTLNANDFQCFLNAYAAGCT
jgi:hypothetical protein